MILLKNIKEIKTIEPVGEIIFGDHFDDSPDWNSNQYPPTLPQNWPQVLMDDITATAVGTIDSNGSAHATGKGITQRWAYRESSGNAQNCSFDKTNLNFPDEFYLGYNFRVDPNWNWAAANSLKIMKIHFNDNTTWDIYWTNFCAGCPSWNVPSGCGFSICTDYYGRNWFGCWNSIADGEWHRFIWHVKHSTGTLELFVDGEDAARTSYDTDFPGTGFDSVYGLHIGGNLSGSGAGLDNMWTMYDDICVGTTYEVVDSFLDG